MVRVGPDLDASTASDSASNSKKPKENVSESPGRNEAFDSDQLDGTLDQAGFKQSGSKKTLRRGIRSHKPIKKDCEINKIQIQNSEVDIPTSRSKIISFAQCTDVTKLDEKTLAPISPKSNTSTLISSLSTPIEVHSNTDCEHEQIDNATNRNLLKKTYNTARNNHRKIAPTMDMLSRTPTMHSPLLSDISKDRVIFSACSSGLGEKSTNSTSPILANTDILGEQANKLKTSPVECKDTKDTKSEALYIQRWYRGYLGRRTTEITRAALERELEEEAWAEVLSEAATAIQSLLRAYSIRKGLSGRLLTICQNIKRAKVQIKWPNPLNLEPTQGWDSIDSMFEAEARNAQIRVFCGTWNLHAKLPTASLKQWISQNQYHIIAIGSEECGATIAKSVVFPSKRLWQDLVQATLGSTYTLLASHALAAIHNMVFAHRSLLPFIRDVQSDAIATGIGNQLGNKGGVGIAFSAGGTSFAFVNAHFEAHQHNVEKRNASFHKINTELRLRPVRFTPGLSQNTSLSKMRTSRASVFMYRGNVGDRLLSESFDRVFWYGDLNYRINGTRKMVDTLIKEQNHAVLYSNDQLQREMRESNVFSKFHEGPLNFLPTYKFDKNSDQYDSSSKQRIPSWTDRVLFSSNENFLDIQVIRYTSEMQLQSSDHRPVTAVFLVNISLTDEVSEKSCSDPIWSQNATTSRICTIQ